MVGAAHQPTWLSPTTTGRYPTSTSPHHPARGTPTHTLYHPSRTHPATTMDMAHIIPALWAAIALFSEASLNAHPLHFFDHHLQFFLLIYFFFHVFLFHLLVM